MKTPLTAILDKIIEDLDITRVIPYTISNKLELILNAFELDINPPYTVSEQLELLFKNIKISKKEEAYEKTD